MELSSIHFTYPLLLWGLLLIPVLGAFLFFFNRAEDSTYNLEKFIDKHLLPHLLIQSSQSKKRGLRLFAIWAFSWIFLVLALAGPRWNFREIETFSKDQSLVILLDLSESMNLKDVKPSRLMRAKQKIEDLLNASKTVSIGLVAFAADPHMITPITEDKEMIKHLLRSLETDLVYIQGSRLGIALDMAATMLDSQIGQNKAILIVSDGGFEDSSAIIQAKSLGEKGVRIHTMGVGTEEGTLVVDRKGTIIKKNGTVLISKLEKERLQNISSAGKGFYLDSSYSGEEEKKVIQELEMRADAQENIGKKNRIWQEHFYWFILPVLPVILWWFRRGAVIAATLFVFGSLEASSLQDCLKNSEERGEKALLSGDFESAISLFKDPYRKAVAFYRAGQFSQAEELFRQSSREEVSLQSLYNLGNCLAKQQKFQEAIKAYEQVIEKEPNHTKAKENLQLVKNLLEEQEKGSDNSDSKKENEDSSQNKENKNQSSESKEENQEQRTENSKDSDEGKSGKKQNTDGSEQEEKNQENIESQTESKQQAQEEKNQENGSFKEENDEESKYQSLKSKQDQDADLWLNQISNDPKTFLKNKFYIESKKNATVEGVDPW